MWVEGACLYRNPDLDLPQDWNKRQIEYCDKLDIPQTAEGFIDPIRTEMTQLLESSNTCFSRKQDVYIYYPGGGSKGLFRIPRIKARPERPVLQEIKNKVLHRWGILDLLDVLIEADRHVDFSRFFYSTGQRQVLGRKEIKERLLLWLFGIATNLGLKRIYPHLLRHQLLTYLTAKGIIDAKIQLLSGHRDRKSLEIYQGLSLADLSDEYQKAMNEFPIK